MKHINALMTALAMTGTLSACSVESNVQQVWTVEVDAKETMSPQMDKAVEADRRIPQVALAEGPLSASSMNLLSISPKDEVRDGRMVVMDLRMHSKDIPPALANIPGLETKTKVEITSSQGGEAMVRALSAHPVLLADVQFDCKAKTISYAGYHASDTYLGTAAYSFRSPTPPVGKRMPDAVIEKACTSEPAGLTLPS